MRQYFASHLFEGVGERVPKVEDGTTRLLERVVLDDRDLDLDRLRDQRLQPAERITFLVARPVPLTALELGEQVRAGDQRMLDDLGHPGGELTAAERLQRCHIRNDRRRLLEQPDQVLALRNVESDLAADARVDHGDQVGRAVHEVESTEVRRRGEARHVTDDRITERHDRRRAIDVGIEQRVVDVLYRFEVLLTSVPTRQRDREVDVTAARQIQTRPPRRW